MHLVAPAEKALCECGMCTSRTARPDGSAMAAKAGSQANAAGDEHAIDLPPGTVAAQASPGKYFSKMRRYRYASFVAGVLKG
jgi:hypothetical protein